MFALCVRQTVAHSYLGLRAKQIIFSYPDSCLMAQRGPKFMASQGIMSSGIKVGASAVCATSQKAPRKEGGKLGFDLKKGHWGDCRAQAQQFHTGCNVCRTADLSW